MPYSQAFSHWPIHQGYPVGNSMNQQPYFMHGTNPPYPVGKNAGAPYPVPYAPSGPVLKPPASGLPSIMSQFKNSDGTYDINKMMNTMGQMIQTVNQIGGVLKGLVGAFKA